MQLRDLRIGFFLFRFHFRERKEESSVKCPLMESSTDRHEVKHTAKMRRFVKKIKK